MSIHQSSRNFLILPLFLFACLVIGTNSAQAKVGFQCSFVDSSSSNFLLKASRKGISAFQERGLLKLKNDLVDKEAIFDSTLTKITLVYRVKNTEILQPTVLSYDEYKELRYEFDRRKELNDGFLKSFKGSGREARAGEGLAIDVPFKIKSKAFRRIFGGDNIGLRVQGNIGINGNVRQQKFDQLQAANQQNSNTSFQIDMTQQFNITGKIGQKVEVKVDQNSENVFDFENTIRLTYTGDPDEIVQSVEAGNVNLNLGTRLATFSGKNTGLFGVKTQLKAGALSLTGIASLERGQKNRQSPNKDTRRGQFNETNFLQGVYFWLTDRDMVFSDGKQVTNYRENYRRYIGRTHTTVALEDFVEDIEVYVSTTGNNPNETPLFGRAFALQFIEQINDSAFTADRDHVEGNWRQLTKGSDYEFDSQLGYIRLKQAVQGTTALGVSFTTSRRDTFGTLPARIDNCKLILLKPQNPQPTDSTWNLMFRHVYSLQASSLDPNAFKLTMSRQVVNNSSGLEETGPPGQNITYLQFFNFDQESQQGSSGADGFVDNLPSLINYQLGELHFLDLTPFDPSGWYDPPNAGDPIIWPLRTLEESEGGNDSTFTFRAPYLYNNLPSQFAQFGAKWRFETEYKGSTSTFDLGPLVLEGSEEVTLNGTKLMKGTDYTIDYLSGQLRILNEAAKAPGANLEITYESGQVFQLDKKTLLGARAEYELWPGSYLGGMFLYLNEQTLDKRVRIGNEPIRNSLYDLNTSLTFKPYIFTTLVDRLPLITTNTPSEIKFDAEVAQVFPNPNSLSNAATGDYNGLAYLDDFEGSRRSTPLGLLRRLWSTASIPIDPEIDSLRGEFHWWNPNTRNQVPVKDVFPNREVNSQVANTLQSMLLEFTPDTSLGNREESWGGVQRYLGEGYADQSRSQYLEFWIKLPPTPEGRLVVDLGELSEDALPNDSMDSEDKPNPGQFANNPLREYGNGLLSPDEDLGLDHKGGSDPQDSAYWNGLTRPPVPSWDDWYHASNSDNFDQANGTENSRNDEGGTYPDTEDLNDNNVLDKNNSYFSYNIELSESSPYIVGGQDNPKRWRLFRIPLNEADSTIRREVGGPSLTNVRWTRVYMTGMTRKTTLEIVQMDIVSNEWLAQTLSNDSTEYVSPAVVNTHENPGYFPPPGVQGERDPITNIRQREQSLVLKINQLGGIGPQGTAAPDSFFVAKNLYQELNLLEYKRLKMFVHGGGLDGSTFRDGKYQLILRLGQNISQINNNYYDIVQTIKPGWDAQNTIDVALNDLSNLKAFRLADTTLSRTAGRYAWASDSTQPGDSLVIAGNPTLSRVGYIALGVRLLDKYVQGRDDEIWVDELRLSDIYKDPGSAADVSASLKLADFATLNLGYANRDADFHNVNTRIGSQSSNETKRAGLNVALDKFGINQWGFQLPVSVNYSETKGTPKYIPSTDTRLTAETAPDSIKSEQKTLQYNVRFSKSGNSKNPFVRWTLEKLTLGYDYSKDDRSDYNVIQSNAVTDGATAAYNFPTAKGKGIEPLFFMKKIPVISPLGSMRFYYKPTKLQLSARGDRQVRFQETRTASRDSLGNPINQITGSRIFNTQRGINFGFAFFDPLVLDFTRNQRGVLDSTRSWSDLLNYDFGRNSEITQSAQATYSPQLLSWFRPQISYGSQYGWSFRNFNQLNGQAVQNQRTFGTDFTLDFRTIFGSGSGGGGGRGGREDRGREADRGDPRRPPDPKGGKEMAGQPKGGEKGHNRGVVSGGEHSGDSLGTSSGDSTETVVVESAPSVSFGQRIQSIFSPITKALSALDPIALSYDNSEGHQQSGTDGQANLRYQLGLTQDPQIPSAMDSSGNSYTSLPQKRNDETITARSGFRIGRNIRASLNHSLRNSESITNTSQGSVEQTQFWLGSKGSDITAFPFADVTVDWSGLEEISFLSKFAQTISLTSGLSGKVRENWTNLSSNIQSREYTRGWNPLVGANISFKGGFDSQIRFNTSNTYTDAVAQRTRSRASDNQITATVSYSVRTGFRIPIFFLKSIRLENQTTFSLNGDYRASKQEATDQADSDIFAVRAQQSSWSISPRVNYTFSNTVQGGAYVQMQQTKNEVTAAKSRLFEFGIQVNIAIRG